MKQPESTTRSLRAGSEDPLHVEQARDVAALRVGQVIHTGYSLDVPLEVHVNGRRRFLGLPGRLTRSARRTTPSATPAWS